MKRFCRLQFGWPLATALLGFLAVGHGVPVLAQTTGTPLSLTDTDSAGAGCLALTPRGDDGNGGAGYSLTLTQTGANGSGAGKGGVFAASPPRTTALAFWLSAGNGTDLFCDGTLKLGVATLAGQGEGTALQDPTVSDQWRVLRLVGGGPGRLGCG